MSQSVHPNALIRRKKKRKGIAKRFALHANAKTKKKSKQ